MERDEEGKERPGLIAVEVRAPLAVASWWCGRPMANCILPLPFLFLVLHHPQHPHHRPS